MKVVALAFAFLAGSCAWAQSDTPSALDVEILNFALNLEYLEGEFYSCAAYGQSIQASLRGGGPASTGCQKAALGPFGQSIAEQIARDEIAHVSYLRNVLGTAAVPMPAIDIGSAFAVVADAALGGVTLEPAFSPYSDYQSFLLGAFLFEDVGVTAYHGAAPLLNSSSYLSSAAAILGVEAYHAGIIRTLLFQQANNMTEYNVTVETMVDSLSNLRDSLDMGAVNDEGLIDTSGQPILVPADANGLLPSRTPQQVLSIVYGGGTTSGVFFPSGINGIINSTTASS